jgi:hypothetical protein
MSGENLMERLEADVDRIAGQRDKCLELVDAKNARIEALKVALRELADLMDDVVSGDYKPDSFTTQPARAALAKDARK